MRAQHMLVFPINNPLRRKLEVMLADVENTALIVPPPGRPHREIIDRALRDAGVTGRVAVEAKRWPVMLELARSGLGLAIVNSTCTLPNGLIGHTLPSIAATHSRHLH